MVRGSKEINAYLSAQLVLITQRVLRKKGKERYVLAAHPPLFALFLELLRDFRRYTDRDIRLVSA